MTLPPDVQAKVLRFEARVELSTGANVGKAVVLVYEAQYLAPVEEDIRLDALIAFHQGHPEAALDLLATCEDLDSRNLRAAVLLAMSRSDEAISILDDLVAQRRFDAETLCLRALAHLTTGNPVQARLDIRKSKELQPTWESVQATGAKIDYFACVSPAARPPVIPRWPVPISWDFVKEDDESTLRLREASEAFKRLAGHPRRNHQISEDYQFWHAASLANDRERLEEAERCVAELLKANPVSEGLVVWALARHLNIDLGPSRSAMEKLVADGTADETVVFLLARCYFASREADRALDLLERVKARLQGHADESWTVWYVQALALTGHPEQALAMIDKSPPAWDLSCARLTAPRVLAKDNVGRERVLRHLEESYGHTQDPALLFEACQIISREQPVGVRC